jgi:hypothetical protein
VDMPAPLSTMMLEDFFSKSTACSKVWNWDSRCRTSFGRFDDTLPGAITLACLCLDGEGPTDDGLEGSSSSSLPAPSILRMNTRKERKREGLTLGCEKRRSLDGSDWSETTRLPSQSGVFPRLFVGASILSRTPTHCTTVSREGASDAW